MRSWANIVKATAHIPIPPPAASLPKPSIEVLRLGGKEYAIYKAKKQREKQNKEEEERKKYWAAEKASEEFWNEQEYEEESETYYRRMLEQYFPVQFADFTKGSPAQSAKELYEELMGADCEDDQILLVEPDYEDGEKEARKKIMFFRRIGNYEGIYEIETKYYFC